MTDPLSTIQPRVRELRAYSLTPERGHVKLNQNENPWDAPASIKRETLRRLEQRAWSRYPDFSATGLHEQLANFSGWKADGILTGNGSNELIQALLMVTAGEGRRVLLSEPTFALYRQISTVLGSETQSVPLTPELAHDVVAIRTQVAAANPAVTIICSPNNPTGCVLRDEALEALLGEARGLVVIDEAYFEFACHSVVPLLEKHPNLVVLRTFSKAMALAGLRVGYLLAAPELTREIGKAVLPYNLNAFSQTAAEVALEFAGAELQPRIEQIVAERERLFISLGQIEGVVPVPSHANFMLMRSPLTAAELFAELLTRDILVRDVSHYPMLENYLRVSVGTPAENDRLLAAMREIFAAR